MRGGPSAVLVLGLAFGFLPQPLPAQSTAIIKGAGASFPNALYQDAVFAYQFSERHLSGETDARVTYEATGSTTGKSRISESPPPVAFAGSDSLLSEDQYLANPDLRMYPAVAGAVVPIYNVGLLQDEEPLRLGRETLASIFLGDIRYWGDAAIVSDNAGTSLESILSSQLGNASIQVVVRTDGSGTSSIWVAALRIFDEDSLSEDDFHSRIQVSDRPDWCEGNYSNTDAGSSGYFDQSSETAFPDRGGNSGIVVCNKTIHLSKNITYNDGDTSVLPEVRGTTLWQYIRGRSNDGVAAAVLSTENSIGYTVLDQALATGLRSASILTADGIPVQPGTLSLNLALVDLGGTLDKFNNANLFGAGGNAWPAAGYTYFVLRSEDASKTCEERKELLQFFKWFYTSEEVAASAARLGFATLPGFLAENTLEEIAANTRCYSDLTPTNDSIPTDGGRCCSNDTITSTTTFDWCVAPEDGSCNLGKNPDETLFPAAEQLFGPSVLGSFFATYTTAFSSIDRAVAWTFTSLPSNETQRLHKPQCFSGNRARSNATDILNAASVATVIPYMHVGVEVAFHLPKPSTSGQQERFTTVYLTGDVIAKIFLGRIERWNDTEIASLACGACADSENAQLVGDPIQVILRTDASDATLAFTSFLSRSNEEWRNTYGVLDSLEPLRSSAAAGGHPLSGRVLVAASDVAVEANIDFQLGSIGYFAPLRGSTRSDFARLVVSGAPLTRSTESLQACEAVGVTSAVEGEDVEGVYDFTNVSVELPPGCWPMITNYGVAFESALVGNTSTSCNQKEADFLYWLMDGDEVTLPMIKIGIAPTSASVRKASFDRLVAEVTCTGAGVTRRPFVACGAGEILDSDGSTCVECPTNTFKRLFEDDFTGCQNCSAGRFQPGLGASEEEACAPLPREDLNYIPEALRYTAIALFCVNALVGIGCLYWTISRRDFSIVKASQPPFLIAIAVGAIIASATIVPLGMDDKDSSDADLRVSCMAPPWLYSVGFVLTYGSLFAKMERVKRIFNHTRLRRIKVSVKEMARGVAYIMLVNVIILSAWQAIDPLRWRRRVEATDSFANATESRGRCEGENPWAYLLSILGLHLAVLAYGNYSCYVARMAPSDFQESKYIALSMISSLQLLIFGTPLLIFVEGDPTVTYVVLVSILFLQYLGVLLFIFVPKIYLHATDQDRLPDSTSNSTMTPPASRVGSGGASGGVSGVASAGASGGTSVRVSVKSMLRKAHARPTRSSDEDSGKEQSVRRFYQREEPSSDYRSDVRTGFHDPIREVGMSEIVNEDVDESDDRGSMGM